jgi:hypothetical protein
MWWWLVVAGGWWWLVVVVVVAGGGNLGIAQVPAHEFVHGDGELGMDGPVLFLRTHMHVHDHPGRGGANTHDIRHDQRHDQRHDTQRRGEE